MLWDANLFYGKDIFENYGDWFAQTVKAAAANPRINWLIKLHPANIWKRKLSGASGEYGELRIIRESVGELPSHVKLLPADTRFSTLSLFRMADVGITVRGSIGYELPCFGVPVMISSGLDEAASHDEAQVPFLSIVTATYNSAATVRDTLESVLRQTFRDLEHIIVDGGSTDGTIEILKEYGSSIRWISEPDRGIYDAMNKGIAMSRGHWIHLLNSDDFYASNNVLEKIVPLLAPDALNYADLIRLNADGSRVRQSYRFRKWPLYISAFLPHPSLVVSAEQYRVAGLYDSSFRIAADHGFDIFRRPAEVPRDVQIPNSQTIRLLFGDIGGARHDLSGDKALRPQRRVMARFLGERSRCNSERFYLLGHLVFRPRSAHRNIQQSA